MMRRSRGRERRDEHIAKEEKKENEKATENMEKGKKTKSEKDDADDEVIGDQCGMSQAVIIHPIITCDM